MSEQDQDKAAKRAQWEEINRAKALAKQQEKEAAVAGAVACRRGTQEAISSSEGNARFATA